MLPDFSEMQKTLLRIDALIERGVVALETIAKTKQIDATHEVAINDLLTRVRRIEQNKP